MTIAWLAGTVRLLSEAASTDLNASTAFDFATQQRVLRMALHDFASTANEATPNEVLTVKLLQE